MFAPDAAASKDSAYRGTRQVWIEGGWRETAIWSRLDLPVGDVVRSPAILEQPDATVFVDPGLQARVDMMGNLILERSA